MVLAVFGKRRVVREFAKALAFSFLCGDLLGEGHASPRGD